MGRDTMTINGRRRPGKRRRRGFTLAEATMALTVLGIAVAGVLLPFSGGARVRAEGNRRTLGVKLAADLMEEVVNTPFDQIVAIYDGYSEAQGQVKDADGNVFVDPKYTNFSREAICVYVYVPQENGAGVPGFIRATVQVSYNGALTATVNRLVSK